jgi:hypothetical protein
VVIRSHIAAAPLTGATQPSGEIDAPPARIWQRILPFVFFVFGMGSFGWTGWTRRRSIPFALLCSLVPAYDPLVLDIATEVIFSLAGTFCCQAGDYACSSLSSACSRAPCGRQRPIEL